MNQAKAGVSGKDDKIVLYLLNFLNKLKCGKLVQETNDGWIVDFNILENKNDKISKIGNFEFPTFPYQHKKPDYKVGRKVIVFFFDDFEEMFINANQTKEINSAYKHSLSNGIIMDVLEPKENEDKYSYIDYRNGLSLFSALGSSLILKEKIRLQNEQTNIVSTFEAMFDNLLNQIQITTATGSPCAITNVSEVKQAIMEEVKKLFEN